MINEANLPSSACNLIVGNPRRDQVAPTIPEGNRIIAREGRSWQQIMEKDFDGWCNYKKALEGADPPQQFNEGEIWHCALGHDIGDEIAGSSKQYSRPVLILRKFSPLLFIGLPISRHNKRHPFRIPFELPSSKDAKGRTNYAIINQIRALDARRLQRLLIAITAKDLKEVRTAVIEMLE